MASTEPKVASSVTNLRKTSAARARRGTMMTMIPRVKPPLHRMVWDLPPPFRSTIKAVPPEALLSKIKERE